MKKRRMENWEKYGMDYAPKQIKSLKLGDMKVSQMSPLEVFIEGELSEKNLPETDDFGGAD